MRVYMLNDHEVKLINNLNRNRKDVLMIICDHGDGPCLEMEGLEMDKYKSYMNALRVDPSRVVEIDVTEEP